MNWLIILTLGSQLMAIGKLPEDSTHTDCIIQAAEVMVTQPKVTATCVWQKKGKEV